ncbi:MAG: glycosyltransferase family 4 protein [Porphyromonadaceae bacterium]|nr:MAG: glycosyltransferase family 4 protein [Porphyromonadaceae bacterium]
MRPYACTIIHNTWNENSHVIVVIKDEKYKRDFGDLDPERVHFVTYPKCKLGKLWFKIQPTALIKEIKRTLKKVQIDVVYSLTGELVLSDFIKPLQKQVPVLYTVHDAIPHETKLPLIEKLKERYIVLKPQQKLFKRTLHKVTNSKAQFEYVSKHHTNSKNIFYAPFPSLMNDDIKKTDKLKCPKPKASPTISYSLETFTSIKVWICSTAATLSTATCTNTNSCSQATAYTISHAPHQKKG